ncbi:MAG: DUF3017 domain-containing protein [Streptosporangiaceae bacterium]
MTDDVTGITPPAGPGGVAAYGLASMAGTGPGSWPPPESGRTGRGSWPPPESGGPQPAAGADSPSYPPRPASARPGYSRPGTHPEPAVHHQHQPAPHSPATTPRGARARRSGTVRGDQLPYVIVLAGLAAGLGYIWQGSHFVRAGTFILAGALFVAVAARIALPERRAGMLASRRRYIDVTALAILAIGLLVAGLVLPTPS